MCICIFPIPVEIYQVSFDITLELITLWVKAPGKIIMQKAEVSHQYSCPFCSIFHFINLSRVHSIHVKYVVSEGLCFFFFQKEGENNFSDCFLVVVIRTLLKFCQAKSWLPIYKGLTCLFFFFFFFSLPGIGRQAEMVSFSILLRAPGGSERDTAALNKAMT